MVNLDAEKGLLSCLIHAPQLIDYIQTLVDEDTFHGFQKYLYLKILNFHDTGRPIEQLALQIDIDEERGYDWNDKVTFTEICDFVPTPTHYDYYLGIVRDKRALTILHNGSSNISIASYKHKADPNILIEQWHQIVKQAKGLYKRKNDIQKLGSLVTQIHDEIDVRSDKPVFKIRTGFKTINKLIPSLEPGDVFVIAARPSVGKTSLALEMLMHIAFAQGVTCGFFSLEMSALQIIFRMIQSLSFTNIQDHFNKPTRESWQKIAAAAKLLIEKNNIYIDDTAGLEISEFRRKCRILKELGAEVVAIDYIQLMTAAIKAKQNKENELSYISSEIKGVAKEFGLRIIMCAQLNRKPEQRKGKKPLLSDLRESGSIEQDADIVGLLSRDFDEKLKILNCNLNIQKNRNGPTDNCHLSFIKHLSKFTDIFYEPK